MARKPQTDPDRERARALLDQLPADRVAKAIDAMTPKRPGRPPRAGGPSGMLHLRVSDEERARWGHAAEAEGYSLSEWIRAALDERAAR